MKNKKGLSVLLVFFALSAFSQQASYFDPAQAYNRFLLEKNSGTYIRIGNYKVTGTPFLFGEKNMGDLYSVKGPAKRIPLRYNTNNQDVEFFISSNKNEAVTKEPGTLDSFVLWKNSEAGLLEDVVFIYGSVIGTKEKAYYQLVQKGQRVTLYKKYTSELGIVSSNYVQADLRQFNLLVDYYYTDSVKKGIKKLKVSPSQLVKEFEGIKDLSLLIDADALTANKEHELTRLFQEMNKN